MKTFNAPFPQLLFLWIPYCTSLVFLSFFLFPTELMPQPICLFLPLPYGHSPSQLFLYSPVHPTAATNWSVSFHIPLSPISLPTFCKPISNITAYMTRCSIPLTSLSFFSARLLLSTLTKKVCMRDTAWVQEGENPSSGGHGVLHHQPVKVRHQHQRLSQPCQLCHLQGKKNLRLVMVRLLLITTHYLSLTHYITSHISPLYDNYSWPALCV